MGLKELCCSQFLTGKVILLANQMVLKTKLFVHLEEREGEGEKGRERGKERGKEGGKEGGREGGRGEEGKREEGRRGRSKTNQK